MRRDSSRTGEVYKAWKHGSAGRTFATYKLRRTGLDTGELFLPHVRSVMAIFDDDGTDKAGRAFQVGLLACARKGFKAPKAPNIDTRWWSRSAIVEDTGNLPLVDTLCPASVLILNGRRHGSINLRIAIRSSKSCRSCFPTFPPSAISHIRKQEGAKEAHVGISAEKKQGGYIIETHSAEYRRQLRS